MVAAEANHARPPHPGLEFRHLLHERGYRRTVCPTSWILDGIEILLNACFRLLRLQFSHGTLRGRKAVACDAQWSDAHRRLQQPSIFIAAWLPGKESNLGLRVQSAASYR